VLLIFPVAWIQVLLYNGRYDSRLQKHVIIIMMMMIIIISILLLLLLFTAIELSPGGSGYFTCRQNMKSVTTKFKSGGLHEKHVMATWNLGNHLNICF